MNTAIIIDDDRLFQTIVSKMMHMVNPELKLIMCENGQSGLEALANIGGEAEMTILLLDINMPVMDGWSFLDVYGSLSLQIKEKIRLYMVTSSTDPDDILRAKENPDVINLYIKPLSMEDIKSILVCT